MKNSFVKGFLAFCAVMLSFAAAIGVVMQVFKKFFTVSIEFSPKYENDECECEDCCEEVEADDSIEFNLCDEDAEVENA
ncbi:MAG: hypothetical protein IJX51_08220 [Clostridia bacterium]|nr:hypothetical protein [Clostridia bacterium]